MRLLLLLLILYSCNNGSNQLNPNYRSHNGHAHNDYEHERPLFDALEYGFRSIEVDVHAWEGRLIVSHDSVDFSGYPNLLDLYLDPLDSLINNEQLVMDKEPLILMVDLKTRKEEALHLLNDLTETRRSLFYKKGDPDSGPIQILISGNPPIHVLEGLQNSYLFIDGRVDIDYPLVLQSQVSRISGKYYRLLGHLLPEERGPYIRDLLVKIHNSSQELRFWSTEDIPGTWEQLNHLGVDWIGTDNLKGYSEWIKFYSEDPIK